MRFLTSGDIAEIVAPDGVTDKQFQAWCNHGLILPTAGGGSRGCRRKFTLMQAVGIAVAAKVFRREQGCAAAYVGKVAGAFAGLTVEELMREFRAGRTHFITLRGGKLLLGGAHYPDLVDVQQAYQDVLAAVAGIEDRLKTRPAAVRFRELASRGK